MTHDHNTYPRETKELQPFTVTMNGANITADVEYAIVLDPGRPTTWTAPVLVDGILHAWIDELDIGAYHLWARVTDSPEIVVIDCGTIYIT